MFRKVCVSLLPARSASLEGVEGGGPKSQLASLQSAAEYAGTFRQVQEVYSQLRPSLLSVA